MTDLRKLARGQECCVRLPGCDGGGETTVLAHLRIRGSGGTGKKPSDMPWGAFCCFNCHRIVDSIAKLPHGYTREQVLLDHAIGCLLTIEYLAEHDLLGKVKR